MSIFSKDLGIDLGTSNVVVYAEGKGIVLREPSVIAVDKNTGKILKVGAAARNMLGRTPGNVVAMRPLREGVVADYELTQRMLGEFFRQIFMLRISRQRVWLRHSRLLEGAGVGQDPRIRQRLQNVE